MTVFLLYPRKSELRDTAWKSSAYQGICLVVAEGPQRARLYAAAAFLHPIATDDPPEGSAPEQGGAWLQPRLVQLQEASDNAVRTSLPFGAIIAPGHACPYLRADMALHLARTATPPHRAAEESSASNRDFSLAPA
ncbi:hypothetical protein [Roseomonas sp. BN140053]|uniref:hypothetical protein n=1 Tax=Roseomonas sp. BN140053 TaxID=3391898 RepID=UPI0039E8015E